MKVAENYAYVLFLVGGMRHFEVITITVRFSMSVYKMHFILLLLSLFWLSSTSSSLCSLRIFSLQCERLLNMPLAPLKYSWIKYTLIDLGDNFKII